MMHDAVADIEEASKYVDETITNVIDKDLLKTKIDKFI
jgi:hypothetical protein